tara:strand:+ start:100 stop:483 length:384 start_codon:yes stop_codon:yes gene_type:complete
MLQTKMRKDGIPRVILVIKGNRKSVPVDKLVAHCYLDNYDKSKTVIHLDGDLTNNDLVNLQWERVATRAPVYKVSARSVSGYTGVTYIKKLDRWNASLQRNGKRYAATFKTKHEAIVYRKTMEREMF